MAGAGVHGAGLSGAATTGASAGGGDPGRQGPLDRDEVRAAPAWSTMAIHGAAAGAPAWVVASGEVRRGGRSAGREVEGLSGTGRIRRGAREGEGERSGRGRGLRLRACLWRR